MLWLGDVRIGECGDPRRVRDTFGSELRRLGDQLACLAWRAGVALRLASQALLTADPDLAEEVIADDADLDADRGRCEQHAERLVAVHASVPADLRSIVAVVLSADGIQRMGHLPVHIAAAVRSSDPGLVVPAELRDVVAEVVAITTGMADRVAVLVADPARAGLAELRSARGTVHNL